MYVMGTHCLEGKMVTKPVRMQRLCRAHEELLWGLERDARVQGKLQVSRRKILQESKQTISYPVREAHAPWAVY